MTLVTTQTRVATAADRSLSPWLAGLLYLALSVVATWPLFQHPATETFRTGGDTYLNLWTLGWDVHAFLQRPWAIFDANIYYPEPRTLAFSENLIGCAILAAPVVWLTRDLVLAFNVVTLLSCALCGMGAYLLGRRVGLGWRAALVTGLVFAFAPPRFFRLAQPHLNAVQWIPFTLAFLHGYLDGGRRRDLLLAIAFFSLQALTSGHGAVLLALTLAVFMAWRLLLGEPVAPVKRLREVGVAGALLLLPAILVLLPYRQVQEDAGWDRGVLGTNWGTNWQSFLESPAHLHQFLLSIVPGLEINQRAENALFPGIAALALGLVAVWPRRKERAQRPSGVRDPRERAVGVLAVLVDVLLLSSLAGLCAFAALGPFKWKWDGTVVVSARSPWRFGAGLVAGLAIRWWFRREVPLGPARWFGGAGPRLARSAAVMLRCVGAAWRERRSFVREPVAAYAMLTATALAIAAPRPFGLWRFVYAWPGFDFLRAPARVTLIAVLGLAVLAGAGFDRLFRRLSSRRQSIALAFAASVIMADCLAIPMVTRPFVVAPPAIDRWLDTRPKPFVVAEFPVPASRATATFESFQGGYMLHSTAHWQKTIHGFSGHRTALHEDLYDLLATFPDERGLRRLRELNVTYVVVHTDYYPPGGWERDAPRFAALADRLRLIHVEGEGRVYEIERGQGRTEN